MNHWEFNCKLSLLFTVARTVLHHFLRFLRPRCGPAPRGAVNPEMPPPPTAANSLTSSAPSSDCGPSSGSPTNCCGTRASCASARANAMYCLRRSLLTLLTMV